MSQPIYIIIIQSAALFVGDRLSVAHGASRRQFTPTEQYKAKPPAAAINELFACFCMQIAAHNQSHEYWITKPFASRSMFSWCAVSYVLVLCACVVPTRRCFPSRQTVGHTIYNTGIKQMFFLTIESARTKPRQPYSSRPGHPAQLRGVK